MNVSITTLLWNNWHVAKNGILSMRRLLDRDDVCELLVLDNGSTDETREAAQCVQDWPKTRLIRSDENLGCGGGRQVLFSAAQGDRILSLDSDAIVIDASIVDILESALQQPGVGIAGDYGGNLPLRFRRGFQMRPRDYCGIVDAVSGYCQYFRRELIARGVSIDPRFYLQGHEDSDFCLTIRYITGQRAWMQPCPILHTWSSSLPGNSVDKWQQLQSKWVCMFQGQPRPRKTFDKIYAERRWGLGSGEGSDTTLNAPYRELVSSVLRQHNAQTVLDAGCGDGRALKGCDFGGARYHGVDVVPGILTLARQRIPDGEFSVIDLLGTPVVMWPDADAVLLKDVLQHWPNATIASVIKELTKKYRLTIVTNCSIPVAGYPAVNHDITLGDFRPLDLALPPFSQSLQTLLRYATTKRVDQLLARTSNDT